MEFLTEMNKRIIEHLSEGVYVLNELREIVIWNSSAEEITGYKREEVLGHRCSDHILIHVDEKGNQLCFGGCPVEKAMSDVSPMKAQVYLHHKDGHRVPVQVSVLPLVTASGRVEGAIEMFTNKSLKLVDVEQMKELVRNSYCDVDTGLLNKRYGLSKLQSLLDENEKNGSKIDIGVFAVKVNNAPYIKKRYGNSDHTRFLKVVANTIDGCVEGIHTICRWDESILLVIVHSCRSSLLMSLGERIRMLLMQTYLMLGGERTVPSVYMYGFALNKQTGIRTVDENIQKMLNLDEKYEGLEIV